MAVKGLVTWINSSGIIQTEHGGGGGCLRRPEYFVDAGEWYDRQRLEENEGHITDWGKAKDGNGMREVYRVVQNLDPASHSIYAFITSTWSQIFPLLEMKERVIMGTT